MQVTVFAASWYPRPSSRAIQNGRLFSEIIEWDCSIYTYEHKGERKNQDKQLEEKLSKHNVKYVDTPAVSLLRRAWRKLAPRKFSFQPDSFRRWADLSFKQAIADNPNPDFVISISHPVSGHLAGWQFKKQNPAVKWAAFFSDPWTHWGDVDFRKDNSLEEKLNWQMEQEVIALADVLMFPTEEMAKYFAGYHSNMSEKHIHILPQTIDVTQYQGPIGDVKFQDPLIVRYIGSWYKERNPLPLIKALRAFRNRYPEEYKIFQFELVGYMSQKDDFKKDLQELNVKVIGHVKPKEAFELAKSSDVLLHVGVPSRQDFYRPSKLIDYLLTSRPILCLSSPGAEEKFTIKSNGFYGNIFDENSMVNAINDLVKAYKEGTLASHVAPKEFVMQFDTKTVAQNLVASFNKITSQ